MPGALVGHCGRDEGRGAGEELMRASYDVRPAMLSLTQVGE